MAFFMAISLLCVTIDGRASNPEHAKVKQRTVVLRGADTRVCRVETRLWTPDLKELT